MTTDAKIDRIRTHLRRQLELELSSHTSRDEVVARLATRLNAVNALCSKEFSRSQGNWQIPLIIFLVAVVAVGLATLVRLSAPSVEVQASVTEMELRFPPKASEIAGTLTFVPGSAFGIGISLGTSNATTNGSLGAYGSLRTIFAADGTDITVSRVSSGCFEIHVLAGRLTGTLIKGGSVESADSYPDQVGLGRQSNLHFCAFSEPVLYFRAVEALALSQVLRPFAPTELNAPSIRSGVLVFPDVSLRRTLHDTERLFMGGMRDGLGALRFRSDLDFGMSARAPRVYLFGFAGPQDKEHAQDLRPTFAQYARSSPALTVLVTSVAGLAGMLLGALRWFGVAKQ